VATACEKSQETPSCTETTVSFRLFEQSILLAIFHLSSSNLAFHRYAFFFRMSAFLRYSKCLRNKVKAENPHVDNTDISRLLGHMWRNATPEEKEPFVQQELKESKIPSFYCFICLFSNLCSDDLQCFTINFYRVYLQGRNGQVANDAKKDGNRIGSKQQRSFSVISAS
jgi:hypothetical protein